MTIQFLNQWSGYERGQIVALGGAEEARLIAAGLARDWYQGIDGVSGDGADVDMITLAQVSAPTADMLSIANRFKTYVAPDGSRYMSNATETAAGTALVALGAAASSSGGALAGGGDDVTAILTFDVNGRPTSYVKNGVTWSLAYVSDVPGNAGFEVVATETIALSTADDIVLTNNWDTGYEYKSGNYMKGGAVVMTAAQAVALANEVLVGLGVLASNFRAFVSDVGIKKDAAGVSIVPGAELAWGGWWWSGRIVYMSVFQSTHAAASTSTAKETFTAPVKLLGKYARTTLICAISQPGGTVSGTLAATLQMNGTNVQTGSSSAGNNPQVLIRQEVQHLGAANAQHFFIQGGNTNGYGATGSVSAANQTAAIDTDTTAPSWTFAITQSDTETSTMYYGMAMVDLL